MPNLCVVFQYRLFIFAIFRLLKTSLTHHANAGSSSILLAFAYSATSTGYDSFKSFRGIQLEPPSFHSTRRCHPLVVFFQNFRPFGIFTQPSAAGIAVSSLQCSLISFINTYWFPLLSTCANRFSANTLA
jgi:hypothetical protein